MKAQSVLAPIKAEVVLDNKQGKPYKKPLVIKTATYINKGKDYVKVSNDGIQG